MQGSPPHTREHYLADMRPRDRLGITPAYAGTLIDRIVTSLSSKDHPRIRGNTGLIRNAGKTKSGSPPHTREHWPEPEAVFVVFGITPAYAGTLFTDIAPFSVTQDHPRIRGNTAFR